MKINTLIFDLGAVVIDWNPEHLYRNIFEDEKERHWFLSEICNSDWNVQQDGGRSLAEGTRVLVEKHPKYEKEISAFYGRWTEMLGGEIAGTVEILEEIHRLKSHRLLALTNWSAETFPFAVERYKSLECFEGILVSGHEKMKKPDREIYQLLLDRYQVVPENAVFIDDSLKNIKGAEALGIKGIHFKSPEQLKTDLEKLGVL